MNTITIQTTPEAARAIVDALREAAVSRDRLARQIAETVSRQLEPPVPDVPPSDRSQSP